MWRNGVFSAHRVPVGPGAFHGRGIAAFALLPCLVAVLLHTVRGGSTPSGSTEPSAVAVEVTASVPTCSGTLINPRWVLTAGHCVEHTPPAFVSWGPSTTRAAWRIEARRVVLHPALDAALVEISSDAPVAARPLATSVASIVHPGASLSSAGFGRDPSGALGTLHFLAVTATSIDEQSIRVEGTEVGSCGGDSGGPLLATVGGGTQIVGILLGGSPGCRGSDVFLRTDALAEWIGSVVNG